MTVPLDRVHWGGTDRISNIETQIAAGSGTEIGYVEVAAGTGVSIAGTSSATATTVVGGVAFTFDGSAVWVEFYTPGAYLPTGTSGTMEIALFEGSTLVAGLAYYHNTSTSHGEYGLGVTKLRMDNAHSVAAPTAGQHTYTVKAWVNDASSGPVVGGGDDSLGAPMFLRFVRA